MAKPLRPDNFRALTAHLLPPDPSRPKGGRPPVSARAALTGIVLVLKTGLPWEYLPTEMGCGSGTTFGRRLRDWQQVGLWAALHPTLLERLGRAEQLGWRRATLDITSVPAKREDRQRVRTPQTGASRARCATLAPTPATRRSA